MPTSVDTKGLFYTFGCEHELSDWDTSAGLPDGFARSPDHTIVNTNGVAAQPNPAVYRYGGEINTPPSSCPEGQVELLNAILDRHPSCTVNHRSNLHVHVRVPGLKDSLPHLKLLQRYIHEQLPAVLPLLEPIPQGNTPAERKRARRRKVSHQTFLTPHRLRRQLAATTVKGFFELEVPWSKEHKPLWHAQPRVCVNLRQLLQTDTVEFRHFPGTLSGRELLTCVRWCRDFILAALEGDPLAGLWDRYAKEPVPVFPGFDLDREVGYQATAANNGLSYEETRKNIELILKGTFHASSAYQEALERAGGVPR
jgi:hypothetical protein